MTYIVLIEPADDGSYSAYVPDLPGCTSCGDTIDELRAGIREAVAGHIATLRELGQPVPPPPSTAELVETAA